MLENTEIRSSTPRIEPVQIRSEFSTFLQGIQSAKKPREQSLGEYGSFLQSLSLFLHQDRISSSQEAKALMGDIFYANQPGSPVRLGFLDDVRERVRDEVLDHGQIRAGRSRWGQEV